MASKSGIAIAGSIIVDKINEISSYPASGELTKILLKNTFLFWDISIGL